MFDGVKNLLTTPEVVMTEINSAISANEYARDIALFKDGTIFGSKCLKIILNFNFGREQFVISEL